MLSYRELSKAYRDKKKLCRPLQSRREARDLEKREILDLFLK